MYVAPNAQAGCDIALTVLAEVDEHALLPPLRASLAHGAVVPHEGDYFGPVVNLAARLVDAARAGELLVTEEVARLIDGHYVASPVAAMSFKGFPEAVKAVAIHSVPA